MAIRPGPLTEWPWERMGNFKVRARCKCSSSYSSSFLLAPLFIARLEMLRNRRFFCPLLVGLANYVLLVD
jgi:hypothetical protein